jgi:hypothetical protein
MASHGDRYTKRNLKSRRNKPVDYPPPCDQCAESAKCIRECLSYKTWEKTGV